MGMLALMEMATRLLVLEQGIHLQAQTEFLMDIQVLQTDTQVHPMDMQVHPMDTQVHPMDMLMAMPMVMMI